MSTPANNAPITELRVTIERGDRRCTFTGADLDRLFGGPVSIRLLAVLIAHAHPTSKASSRSLGGRGAAYDRRSDQNARNVDGSEIVLEKRSVRSVPRDEEIESARAKDQEPVAADVDRLASYLADRLGDAKSLPFYHRVASEAPREVVREALVAALDLAPADVRRSRAAYFTAIVRPHLRPRAPRTPPQNLPYAPHTPST